MSKIGGMVLAMQTELECVMDSSFCFHPSELNKSRFEIAAQALRNEGYYVNASDMEAMWDQMNEPDMSPY